MGQIIIKSTYGWNNLRKFMKWITKGELPYIGNLSHNIKKKFKTSQGVLYRKF